MIAVIFWGTESSNERAAFIGYARLKFIEMANYDSEALA